MSLVPPVARIRLVAVFAAAVAVAAGVFDGWGNPPGYAVPALAVAVAAAELAVVHLSFGRQRWSFSMTEAAVGAAFVYSPRGWTILSVFVGVLAAQMLRRQEPLKLAFNVAQFVAATGLGAWFAASVDGGVPGAVGGMAVFWIVNNALMLTAVVTMTGQRLRPLIWASAPFAGIHSVGATGLGILGAWLAANAPVGLFALVVPLLLLWISYDEQATRAAETALYAELARLQERATGRSVDVSAKVVLTAASRLFESPEVEMVLLAQEGPVHFSLDDSAVMRRRVDQDALDLPWVLTALAECGTVTGVEDGRPWCAAVLGGSDTPLAVLLARRDAGRPEFGRRDVQLARVLGEQAEAWLSIAELAESRDEALAEADAADGVTRALGEIGADTEPALRVLRDAANRLARLAAADGEAAVDDIVDELYAAERAVASLLGAIALAAEPDLGRAMTPEDVQLAGARRFDDWTTTGVISA
jgi:hypothetical protein